MEENDVCTDPLRDNGRRKEDHDVIAWIASKGIKYHWLFTLLLLFFLALGFDFKTPSSAFAEVRTMIARDRIVDSLEINEIKVRNTQADRDRTEMRQLLEALVIMQCQRNLKLSQDSRLPCRRLFREWGLE